VLPLTLLLGVPLLAFAFRLGLQRAFLAATGAAVVLSALISPVRSAGSRAGRR